MKKQLLFLTVFFSLFFSNVNSQTVYVTKTGHKYHSESCRFLSNSSIQIKLEDAISRGNGPCSVCKPSSIVQKKSSFSQAPTQGQPLTQKEAQSLQCTATTKAGSRCTNISKVTNGKCWQHGGG